MNSENRSLITSARRFAVRSLRYLSYSFLLAGVAAVSYAGYILADAGRYQAVELRKFGHSAPLIEPHLLTLGEVVGQIEIPSLPLSAVIVQGDSPELLRRAVGHLAETPMPGEWGNIATRSSALFATFTQEMSSLCGPSEERHFSIGWNRRVSFHRRTLRS